jgi:hypothetical protein
LPIEPPESIGALDTAGARAVRVVLARELGDAVGARRFLHAGPPVELDEFVGPMRAAVIGALMFEGETDSPEAAERVIGRGEVELRSCHTAGGTGAMAGVISPSIPVVVVEGVNGVRSFAPLNEGLGQALRFGSITPQVLTRLGWMRDVLAPTLDSALRQLDGVDVAALQAEGLRRGDECHNRNVASTAALVSALAPTIIRASSTSDAADVIEFLSGNPHSFLSFSMAAGKAIADAAHTSAEAGLVTTIAANGVRVGIRVTGTAREWFTAPAPLGKPRFFQGFGPEDACPMMGDSFITETVGLGAFAATAAPAIAAFVGGSPAEAARRVADMRRICRSESTRFLIPQDEFRGTPLGIDVELIRQTCIAPVVNNGIAHRIGGRGQVGAGLTQLPTAPFIDAANALRGIGHRPAA